MVQEVNWRSWSLKRINYKASQAKNGVGLMHEMVLLICKRYLHRPDTIKKNIHCIEWIWLFH